MPIVDKSGSINLFSSVDSPNTTLASSSNAGSVVKRVFETVETVTTDSAGSKYRLCRIPSNALLNSLTLEYDALTTGTAQVGVYYPPLVNAGAAISTSVLLGTTSIATAGSSNAMAAIDIANKGKRLWELAGLTADPNTQLDIVVTTVAAPTVAGTISLTCLYSLV